MHPFRGIAFLLVSTCVLIASGCSDAEIARLEEDKATLGAEKERLVVELAGTTLELADLAGELEAAEQVVATVKQQLEQTLAKLDEAEEQTADLQAAHAVVLSDAKSATEMQVSELQAAHAKELDAAKAVTTKAQTEAEELKKQVTDLASQLAIVRKALEEATKNKTDDGGGSSA